MNPKNIRCEECDDGTWRLFIGDYAPLVVFATRGEAGKWALRWCASCEKSDSWEEDSHYEEETEDACGEFERTLRNPPTKDVAVVVNHKALLADGRFDQGVSYVMEEMDPRDKDLVWVYDKFGEKRQYFRNRFHVVFE